MGGIVFIAIVCYIYCLIFDRDKCREKPDDDDF